MSDYEENNNLEKTSIFYVTAEDGIQVQFENAKQYRRANEIVRPSGFHVDTNLLSEVENLGGIPIDQWDLIISIFSAYGRGSDKNGRLENFALKATILPALAVVYALRKLYGGDDLRSSGFAVLCDPANSQSIKNLLENSESLKAVRKSKLSQIGLEDLGYRNS